MTGEDEVKSGGGEGGHVIDKCKSCTYEYHHHDAKIVETAA